MKFCSQNLENAPESLWLIKVRKNSSFEPFLKQGIVGQLVGAGGIGKTHFLVQLALSIVTGVPFLEEYTTGRPGNVFLGLGENSEDDLHRLLHKMVTSLKFSQNQKIEASKRLAIMSFCGMDASFVKDKSPTAFYNNLFNELKIKEPDDGWSLIIFDPISRLLGADAENDNAAATQFISLLERLSLELSGKPTILFGHHMSKAGFGNIDTDQTAARGSSALTDGVRWQANLEKVQMESSNETDRTKIKFKVVKSNFTEIPDSQILEKDKLGCLFNHKSESDNNQRVIASNRKQ